MHTHIPSKRRLIRFLKGDRPLARRLVVPTSRLQQHQRIGNLAVISADVLPLESSRVNDRQLGEAKVLGVEDGSDVLLTLSGAEHAVALDIASGTVDDVSHGFAGVGTVGVVVDNGCSVDGTVVAEREETLVPVDVTVY